MNDIHMRRFRNIPPLQYLLGFEAAARLGSFRLASEELGLSQSAISHEMRLLEERIGQPLFIRNGRSFQLTDAGRDYQRTVATALDQMERGYHRLAPFRKPGSVIIYAPRDFAARWLLPKLKDLRAAVPQCDPWIDTSGVAVDFENMEVSFAISRVRSMVEGSHTALLVPDVLAPVVSPKLAPKPIKTPADLLKHTLLHDERSEQWRDWFEMAGVTTGDISAGLDFSDSDFALAAAELGLGVALASLPLAHDAIAAGRLIQPLPQVLKTEQSWVISTTAKELNDSVTLAVWNWFKNGAK